MNIREAPGFPAPHGNSVVWRYIALEKFLDLVLNARIYFANVSSFSDQYEATVPRRNVQAYQRALERKGLPEIEIEEQTAWYASRLNSLRGGTLVNCWSAGRHESFPLWRIYLENSHHGVAIRTTVSRLRNAIQQGKDPYPDDVFLGQVKYSDFIPDESPSRYSVILTKTRFYEYEREVRLFILEFPMSEGGVERPYTVSEGRTVAVDLDILIDRIYLSPFAGAWFEGSFRALMTKICPSLLDRIVRSEVREA